MKKLAKSWAIVTVYLSLVVGWALIGCQQQRPASGEIRGVINMGGVRPGWTSHSVPVDHPQLLSDPEGRLVIRTDDCERWEGIHGEVQKAEDGTEWILVPLDYLYRGNYTEVVQVK